MTHILSAEGTGKGDTMMEAVVNAMQEAMAEAGANGDHKQSITFTVIGDVFDGEKYNVSVMVVINDYDLEQEDIYHESQEQLEQRLENTEAVSSAFFASAAFSQGGMGMERAFDLESHLGEHYNQSEVDSPAYFNEDRELFFYASPEVHDRLADEITEEKKEAQLEHDKDVPSLDPDGSHYGGQDKAA